MTANRYKLLIAAVPFPLEISVVASNLDSAHKKGLFQGKMMGLRMCHGKKSLIEHEIIGTVEI